MIIRFAFLCSLAVGIVCNLILPLDNVYALVAVGPTGSLIFVTATAYVMARHALFDIHFFVLRSVIYVMAMFSFMVICVVPVVLLISTILGFHPHGSRLAMVIILSTMAIFLLQYLREIFDKITNKIFYRYYYDPQEVLEKLSDILVRTIDVDELRAKTVELLQSYLNASRVSYILLESPDHDEMHMARALRKYTKSNVIITDDIDTRESKLITMLRNADVTIAVRLRTTHDDLGFLTFGHKQSGEIYSTRDIRLLTTASSSLAISLQNALRFEEIEQFNETLKRKVDDATRKLRATNERLRILDATKDDFISMASHQLRTPLTSVKGYLSLVLDGDAGPVKPAQRKLLSQAFISSQRMVFLIADLLNVSRLKTGKFVIETTAVNLADVVDEEVRQLLETAAGRSLKLLYHKPTHFPLLMLDETKTRQVVMNFIDNAIYYTPAGGQIEVTLLETPKTVELRVVDNGIGVPQAEQYHLFSKFYRAKNAQKARPDGTGLGLFMAKKVIVGQGGAIIFSSQEGRGSTFGFSIPKSKLAPNSTNS